MTIHYHLTQKVRVPGIMYVCEAEGWPSCAGDPDVTWRALTAPGVATVVARDADRVVGFVQMQSDGAIQAHLSLIAGARDRPREGIGTRLLAEAFARCGGKRVGLVTEDARDFCRSFAHKQWSGFRIYPVPGAEGGPTPARAAGQAGRGTHAALRDGAAKGSKPLAAP